LRRSSFSHAMAPRKGETAAEKSVRNAQKCQLFASSGECDDAVLVCITGWVKGDEEVFDSIEARLRSMLFTL
jgi:hypothetical protein